jgi:hypothetical protein
MIDEMAQDFSSGPWTIYFPEFLRNLLDHLEFLLRFTRDGIRTAPSQGPPDSPMGVPSQVLVTA